MAMSPEVKAKWVDALRSGEYEQGQNRLRTKDSFCCLGVLCDLFLKEGRGGKWDDSKGDACFGGQRFEISEDAGSSYGLPDAVKAWAGLPDKGAFVRCEDKPDPVGVDELNDGARGIRPRAFSEIAELIEVQL